MAGKKQRKKQEVPQQKLEEQPVEASTETSSETPIKRYHANRKYKDRVFNSIFGNPEHKDWTLSLYNAVNNSHYTNPDDIQFNTVDNALFLGIHNDVSFMFIILFELNLWEHQSTPNRNLPMRFLRHLVQLYDKYIAVSKYNVFSSTLQPLPRPRCVCFYNGTANEPERYVLKLSEAFGIPSEESDLEVKVTMININYGKNKELMNACKPLKEYAWLVEKIRQHQKETNDLEKAIDLTIDEMPRDFVIRDFIIGHRAEVKKMFLTEWNEQEMRQRDRDEVRMDERHRMASEMINDHKPLDEIIKYSKLAKDVIMGIAKSLKVDLA